MREEKIIGTRYELCPGCGTNCPVAIEAKISGRAGLTLHDDFGGEVKLTDGQLKDFASFLEKRFA